MKVICAAFLCGLLFVYGCSRGQNPKDTQSAAVQHASSPAPGVDTNRPPDRTAPLGEFEPLTQADVDLYLKVMRTAAERRKNLSPADREALNAFRNMTSPHPGAPPSAVDMATMQRAHELLAMDRLVAREMGVDRRYEAISSRAKSFTAPHVEASGDASEMTAEEKRQESTRIDKFQQRRAQDAAMLAPHRDEILALQKQVDLLLHPESFPK